MKNYPLVLIVTCLMLVACGGKKNTEQQPNENKKTLLNEADIFNRDAVNKFLSSSDKNSQQEAKQTFLNGVAQYRNRQQLDSAIATFKQSICIYPFAKTYYELGNVCMDKTDYKTSIEAYKMAESLSYEPVSLVLYNLSCAYSKSENSEESLKYLALAIENGYTNLQHIMNDSDLTFVRKDGAFTETVKTSMAGNTSSEAVLFSMYKSHFTSLTLPYQLDEEKSQKIDFDRSISYDYDDFVPGMVNSEFSRDVGDEYFYVGLVGETDKYVALLYSQAGMWAEKPPVHVYLATYHPEKGRIIDFEKIAGMEYYSDSLRTAVVKQDLSVEVKYFIQEWEKNPDDFGYEGENKRTGLNQVAAKNFKIDVNGQIRETQKMMGVLRRRF
jgi:tetratricopeptide (TPR) repeat protein